LRDFGVSQAVELEEDQGSIELRQLGDGGVELVEAVVIRDRGGEIREFDIGAAGASPVEGTVQRDAVDEGTGLRFRTIEGEGVPEGDEEVLVEILSIGGAGVGAGDLVKDGAVLLELGFEGR